MSLSTCLVRTVFVACSCLAALSAGAQAPIISTVLGAGIGDGAPARQAQLRNALGVVFDAQGNAYIADAGDDRIRKVAANGTISTVAGTGQHTPFTCADGPALSAVLALPSAVALDASGRLLIVDSYNVCVRRIEADGSLTRIAGGAYGFSGDDGQAIDAGLSNPMGIAVDSHGNIYIADSGANRVRKIDLGGTITTYAGSATTDYIGDHAAATSAGLSYPTALAFDAADNLYVADSYHYAIRKIDVGGTITTVAGNGTQGYGGDGGDATAATLSNPYGVRIAPNGDIYIGDSGNAVVRRVNAQGKISTVIGNGLNGYSPDGTPALGAQVPVSGFTFDNVGRAMVLTGPRILRVETNGTLSTFAGAANYANGIAADSASLLFPTAAAADPAGNLYVVDQYNGRVRRRNTDGTVDTIAGDGSQIFSGDGGSAVTAGMALPTAIAVGGGNIYVAESGRIRKIDHAGTITTFAGGSGVGCGAHGNFVSVDALALDAHGTLYAADSPCRRVYAIDGTGAINEFAGNGAFGSAAEGVSATQTPLGVPKGVAVDASGNVYISDWIDSRIHKVNAAGIITTFAGNGTSGSGGEGGPALAAQFAAPSGLAFDAGGNLFIAELGNSVARKIGADGNVHRIAGTFGTQGYAGDGGVALDALLAGPQAVVYDRGTLYIVETFNSRVRAIEFVEIFADGFEP
jgi:sugar lactone lactonase YvrE